MRIYRALAYAGAFFLVFAIVSPRAAANTRTECFDVHARASTPPVPRWAMSRSCRL